MMGEEMTEGLSLKARSERLQAQLQRQAAALDAIDCGIVWLDRNGRIEDCNRAFARLLDRHRDAIVGRAFGDLLALAQQGRPLDPDAYPDIRAKVEKLAPQEYEYWRYGCVYRLTIAGYPLDGMGESSVMLIVEEMGDRAAAAPNANVLGDREFLATLGHRLRSPLNSILGFAQLMGRDANINDTHRKYLDLIGRNGKQLLGTIDDLLKKIKEQ